MSFIKKILDSWTIEKSLLSIFVLYLMLAVGASVQSYLQVNHPYPQYTQYNNYVIFKQSHFHLLNDSNLYRNYYSEHGDLYKYSPTFALFFGAFSYFPNLLGLTLWNVLNCIVFFLSIYKLPLLDNRKKLLLLLFCLIELMTAMQNEQSNALLAGLIILGFGMLEKKNYLLATLLIVGTVYIKLFGIVAFSLFLLYPKKWKLALYTLLWMIVLFVLPLIFIDFSSLKTQYQNWGVLLQSDHDASIGLSVIGFLKSWFNVEANKFYTVLTGALIFCLPLIRFRKYSHFLYRVLMLSSVLIWVIIFNHKAESSTFIIAISGIALWFYLSPKSILNLVLLILAFIFISLSPTDIFPRSIRENYVIPYVLKAVPAIVIWLKIIYDSFAFNKQGSVLEKSLN